MLFTNEEILKNQIKQMARKRTFFSILCFLIILPLIIYNLLLVFELKINPEKLIDIAGYKPYIVTSDNFSSELYKGDIINVKSVLIEDLNKEDIIILNNKNGITLGKVEEINTATNKVTVSTESSNNEKITLSQSNVLGKYDFKIFDLKLIITFLQDKILLVYLILIIYILYMRNSYKTERSQIRKLKKEIYDKKIQENT